MTEDKDKTKTIPPITGAVEAPQGNGVAQRVDSKESTNNKEPRINDKQRTDSNEHDDSLRSTEPDPALEAHFAEANVLRAMFDRPLRGTYPAVVTKALREYVEERFWAELDSQQRQNAVDVIHNSDRKARAWYTWAGMGIVGKVFFDKMPDQTIRDVLRFLDQCAKDRQGEPSSVSNEN